MRHSIATLSLSGILPEKLQAIAAAGFDGFELFENDLLAYPGYPGEIRRMAEDLGLTIEIFQPFRDFEGVGPEQLARNLARAEAKFDLMEQLGVELMLVCSNAQPGVSGSLTSLVHCRRVVDGHISFDVNPCKHFHAALRLMIIS